MANITLLPSAKVPLIYPDTNTMSTEWYRFFWNIYGFTAAGVIPVDKGGTGLNTIGNHQIIIGNANTVFEPASLSSASIAITYPAGYVNLELGTSGVTPGTYGSASQVGVFTVNQYGVLTAASNTSIGIDANQIISGTLPVTRGGTGQSTYTDGQLLIGNTTGNTLIKATLTAGTGISITNGAGSITIANTGVLSVTGTAPVVSSGGTTPAISMAAATGSVNGYLTSTDWTTFNNKGSGSVTSVAASVPAFLSISGSPITTSGTLAITLSGTALPVTSGGTGLTSLTASYIPYGNGTSAFSSGTGLTFDGTNLKIGTSNGGVIFSNGSALVNSTLNDYETGTWTPNQGAGLTVVGAFSSSGSYTKIGNQVTVYGKLTGATSIAISATASVVTTNMPFTCASTLLGVGNAINSTSTSSAIVNIAPSSTTVYSDGIISAAASIFFSITYQTTF